MRGEWSGLRRGGVSSVWAPACQDTSWCWCSLKGASLALPTFATAQFQFQRFFDCGRAVRCLLPPGRVHQFLLW